MKIRITTKIIASITCILFAWNTLVYSAYDAVYSVQVPEQNGHIRQRYKVPREYGHFSFADSPTPDKAPHVNKERTVIVIEDAHASLTAQENIAEIITSLAHELKEKSENGKTRQPLLVGVEGAIGELSFADYRAITVRKARNTVARDYLERGIFTGSEYAAITAQVPFRLFGVEDEELFNANFKAFQRGFELQEDLRAAIAEVYTVLTAEKEKYYNDTLKAFDSASTEYARGAMDITDYITRIFKEAERLGLELTAFPSLTQLYFLSEEEARLDFEKAQSEKEKLRVLVETKEGNISDTLSDYALAMLLKGRMKSFACDNNEYQNFLKLCTYLVQYAQLDFALITRDVECARQTILGALAQSAQEKEIVKRAYYVSLAEKVLNLSARRYEVDTFKTLVESDPHAFSFLDVLGIEATRENRASLPSVLIDSITQYYECAHKRDEAMTHNLLRKMNDSDERTALFIVGGYHTEGVTQFLREAGINYLVVTPECTDSIITLPYLDRMTGKLFPLTPHLESHFTALQSAIINDPKKLLIGFNKEIFAEIFRLIIEEEADSAAIKAALSESMTLSDASVEKLMTDVRKLFDDFVVSLKQEESLERKYILDNLEKELAEGRYQDFYKNFIELFSTFYSVHVLPFPRLEDVLKELGRYQEYTLNDEKRAIASDFVARFNALYEKHATTGKRLREEYRHFTSVEQIADWAYLKIEYGFDIVDFLDHKGAQFHSDNREYLIHSGYDSSVSIMERLPTGGLETLRIIARNDYNLKARFIKDVEKTIQGLNIGAFGIALHHLLLWFDDDADIVSVGVSSARDRAAMKRFYRSIGAFEIEDNEEFTPDASRYSPVFARFKLDGSFHSNILARRSADILWKESSGLIPQIWRSWSQREIDHFLYRVKDSAPHDLNRALNAYSLNFDTEKNGDIVGAKKPDDVYEDIVKSLYPEMNPSSRLEEPALLNPEAVIAILKADETTALVPIDDSFVYQYVNRFNAFSREKRIKNVKAPRVITPSAMADYLYLKAQYNFDLIDLMKNGKTVWQDGERSYEFACDGYTIECSGRHTNDQETHFIGYARSGDYALAHVDDYDPFEDQGRNIGAFLIKLHHWSRWFINNENQVDVPLNVATRHLEGLIYYYGSIGAIKIGKINNFMKARFLLNGQLNSGILTDEKIERLWKSSYGLAPHVWRVWSQRELDTFFYLTREVPSEDLIELLDDYSEFALPDSLAEIRTVTPRDVSTYVCESYFPFGSDAETVRYAESDYAFMNAVQNELERAGDLILSDDDREELSLFIDRYTVTHEYVLHMEKNLTAFPRSLPEKASHIADLFYLKKRYSFDINDLVKKGKTQWTNAEAFYTFRYSHSDGVEISGKHTRASSDHAIGKALYDSYNLFGAKEHETLDGDQWQWDIDTYDDGGRNIGNMLIKIFHYITWMKSGDDEIECTLAANTEHLKRYYASIGARTVDEFAFFVLDGSLKAGIITSEERSALWENGAGLHPYIWRTWSQRELDRFFRLIKTIPQNITRQFLIEYSAQFDEKKDLTLMRTKKPEDVYAALCALPDFSSARDFAVDENFFSFEQKNGEFHDESIGEEFIDSQFVKSVPFPKERPRVYGIDEAYARTVPEPFVSGDRSGVLCLDKEKGAALHPDDVAEIKKLISMNRPTEKNERNYVYTLQYPLASGITSVQIKGIVFDAIEPFDKHTGIGIRDGDMKLSAQPDGKVLVSEYAAGNPQGALRVYEAVREYLLTHEAQHALKKHPRVRVKEPIGFGWFDDLYYRNDQLGFVLFGMDEAAASYRGHGYTADSFYRVGQALAALHQNGITFQGMHEFNVTDIDAYVDSQKNVIDGYIYIHDLADGMSTAFDALNQDEFLAAQLLDYAYMVEKMAHTEAIDFKFVLNGYRSELRAYNDSGLQALTSSDIEDLVYDAQKTPVSEMNHPFIDTLKQVSGNVSPAPRGGKVGKGARIADAHTDRELPITFLEPNKVAGINMAELAIMNMNMREIVAFIVRDKVARAIFPEEPKGPMTVQFLEAGRVKMVFKLNVGERSYALSIRRDRIDPEDYELRFFDETEREVYEATRGTGLVPMLHGTLRIRHDSEGNPEKVVDASDKNANVYEIALLDFIPGKEADAGNVLGNKNRALKQARFILRTVINVLERVEPQALYDPTYELTHDYDILWRNFLIQRDEYGEIENAVWIDPVRPFRPDSIHFVRGTFRVLMFGVYSHYFQPHMKVQDFWKEVEKVKDDILGSTQYSRMSSEARADKSLRDFDSQVTDGFISEGEVSRHIFNVTRRDIKSNDITHHIRPEIAHILEFYKKSIRSRELNILHQNLKSLKVYGFKEIIAGENDFFLGYYDRERNELYVAEDLLNNLKARGPQSLSDEFLFHEFLCGLVQHRIAIGIQQRMFRKHYENADLDTIPSADRIYKGELGRALREEISISNFRRLIHLKQISEDSDDLLQKIESLEVNQDVKDALLRLVGYTAFGFNFSIFWKKLRAIVLYDGAAKHLVHRFAYRALLLAGKARKTKNSASRIIGLAGELSGIYEIVIKRGTSLTDLRLGELLNTNQIVDLDYHHVKEFDAVSENAVFEFKFNLSLRKLYQQVIGIDSAKTSHLKVLTDVPAYQDKQNLVYFGERDSGHVVESLCAFLEKNKNIIRSGRVMMNGGQSVSVKLKLEEVKEFLLAESTLSLAHAEGKFLPESLDEMIDVIDAKIEQVQDENFHVVFSVSHTTKKEWRMLEGIVRESAARPKSVSKSGVRSARNVRGLLPAFTRAQSVAFQNSLCAFYDSFRNKPRIYEVSKFDYRCGTDSGFWTIGRPMKLIIKDCMLIVFYSAGAYHLAHVHVNDKKNMSVREVFEDYRKNTSFGDIEKSLFTKTTYALIINDNPQGEWAGSARAYLEKQGILRAHIAENVIPDHFTLASIGLIIDPKKNIVEVSYKAPHKPIDTVYQYDLAAFHKDGYVNFNRTHLDRAGDYAAWSLNPTYLAHAWWVETLVSSAVFMGAKVGLGFSIMESALAATIAFWGAHISRLVKILRSLDLDYVASSFKWSILFNRDVATVTGATFLAMYGMGHSFFGGLLLVGALAFLHYETNRHSDKWYGMPQAPERVTVQSLLSEMEREGVMPRTFFPSEERMSEIYEKVNAGVTVSFEEEYILFTQIVATNRDTLVRAIKDDFLALDNGFLLPRDILYLGARYIGGMCPLARRDIVRSFSDLDSREYEIYNLFMPGTLNGASAHQVALIKSRATNSFYLFDTTFRQFMIDTYFEDIRNIRDTFNEEQVNALLRDGFVALDNRLATSYMHAFSSAKNESYTVDDLVALSERVVKSAESARLLAEEQAALNYNLMNDERKMIDAILDYGEPPVQIFVTENLGQTQNFNAEYRPVLYSLGLQVAEDEDIAFNAEELSMVLDAFSGPKALLVTPEEYTTLTQSSEREWALFREYLKREGVYVLALDTEGEFSYLSMVYFLSLITALIELQKNESARNDEFINNVLEIRNNLFVTPHFEFLKTHISTQIEEIAKKAVFKSAA